MNSLALAQPAVKMQDAPTAFDLGVMDAKSGDRCIPEMYFAKPEQKADYCLGFESVAGDTLAGDHFLRSPKRIIAVGKIQNGVKTVDTLFAAVALQELQDDMADRDYWASGNW